jgi:hypothetical protein
LGGREYVEREDNLLMLKVEATKYHGWELKRYHKPLWLVKLLSGLALEACSGVPD